MLGLDISAFKRFVVVRVKWIGFYPTSAHAAGTFLSSRGRGGSEKEVFDGECSGVYVVVKHWAPNRGVLGSIPTGGTCCVQALDTLTPYRTG